MHLSMLVVRPRNSIVIYFRETLQRIHDRQSQSMVQILPNNQGQSLTVHFSSGQIPALSVPSLTASLLFPSNTEGYLCAGSKQALIAGPHHVHSSGNHPGVLYSTFIQGNNYRMYYSPCCALINNVYVWGSVDFTFDILPCHFFLKLWSQHSLHPIGKSICVCIILSFAGRKVTVDLSKTGFLIHFLCCAECTVCK